MELFKVLVTCNSSVDNQLPLSQPHENSDKIPPVEAIYKIRQLLSRIVEQHSEQNYEEAKNLVRMTYKANFESIKDHLQKLDEKLAKDTEENLRDQLTELIEDKAPLQEIQQLVNEINNNLDSAEQLLLRTTT